MTQKNATSFCLTIITDAGTWREATTITAVCGLKRVIGTSVVFHPSVISDQVISFLERAWWSSHFIPDDSSELIDWLMWKHTRRIRFQKGQNHRRRTFIPIMFFGYIQLVLMPEA
jgi:hypothetical protein